jgi:type IV pilus assembly protein PilC
MSRVRSKRVSAEELALFTRQIASMHHAGISLLRAFEFYSGAGTTPLAAIAGEIATHMRHGYRLSYGIRQHPEVFSDVYASLIEAGEASGEMRDILVKMADLGERNRKLRQRILATLTYPAVLVVACILSLGFFVFVVLPSILPLFESMHLRLPLLTRVLAEAGDLAHRPLAWVLGVALIGALSWTTRRFLRRVDRDSGLRKRIEAAIFRLPVVGPTVEKVLVARMLYTVATLLDAAVFLESALTKAGEVTANALLIERMKGAVQAIHDGARMGDALAEWRVFPKPVLQMIRAAEESGGLVTTMHQTSRLYEDEVEFALMNLSALLEPVIMMVMGVISAFIVLSVILPTVQLLNHL